MSFNAGLTGYMVESRAPESGSPKPGLGLRLVLNLIGARNNVQPIDHPRGLLLFRASFDDLFFLYSASLQLVVWISGSEKQLVQIPTPPIQTANWLLPEW